jgi:hypothetical protein
MYSYRHPGGHHGDLELRFGQAGGGHLPVQFGTCGLFDLHWKRLRGGLRERTR